METWGALGKSGAKSLAIEGMQRSLGWEDRDVRVGGQVVGANTGTGGGEVARGSA